LHTPSPTQTRQTSYRMGVFNTPLQRHKCRPLRNVAPPPPPPPPLTKTDKQKKPPHTHTNTAKIGPNGRIQYPPTTPQMPPIAHRCPPPPPYTHYENIYSKQIPFNRLIHSQHWLKRRVKSSKYSNNINNKSERNVKNSGALLFLNLSLNLQYFFAGTVHMRLCLQSCQSSHRGYRGSDREIQISNKQNGGSQ
jgi:hypothetical protein